MTREAACHCGQLRLDVEGEPFAVSICNCLACQRRTGSAFGMQAAFRPHEVRVHGRFKDYVRISDEADRKAHTFHFCPDCGSQVFGTEPGEDFVVVSVGAFADPSFPPPAESGYDSRRHPWIGLPESVQRFAPELWWDNAKPLYDEGRYAEAADRGVELVAERPDQPYLFYNTACCEALAGRTSDALAHLARAIEMWDGCREMAANDSDFDAIRDEPAFEQLVGR